MLLRGLSAFFLSSVLFCTTSGAAVFERDWQTSGDGLLTYDDVNQREWLDLSETILDQFLGATLEEKYQSVVAETAPGGMFEDFTVAKGVDAEALALSAGIDITTGDFSINENATRNIINLLGITFVRSVDRFSSRGAVDETDSDFPSPGRLVATFVITDRRNEGFVSTSGFGLNIIGENIDPEIYGVMLYRQAIPEPSSTILVFQSSLLLLAENRRRRR